MSRQVLDSYTQACASIGSGLDALSDHIMEIAVLITDGELTGPHLEVSRTRRYAQDVASHCCRDKSQKLHSAEASQSPGLIVYIADAPRDGARKLVATTNKLLISYGLAALGG